MTLSREKNLSYFLGFRTDIQRGVKLFTGAFEKADRKGGRTFKLVNPKRKEGPTISL